MSLNNRRALSVIIKRIMNLSIGVKGKNQLAELC